MCPLLRISPFLSFLACSLLLLDEEFEQSYNLALDDSKCTAESTWVEGRKVWGTGVLSRFPSGNKTSWLNLCDLAKRLLSVQILFGYYCQIVKNG
jgi:hypothetical protein